MLNLFLLRGRPGRRLIWISWPIVSAAAGHASTSCAHVNNDFESDPIVEISIQLQDIYGYRNILHVSLVWCLRRTRTLAALLKILVLRYDLLNHDRRLVAYDHNSC
jgi:hypothetical protein